MQEESARKVRQDALGLLNKRIPSIERLDGGKGQVKGRYAGYTGEGTYKGHLPSPDKVYVEWEGGLTPGRK